MIAPQFEISGTFRGHSLPKVRQPRQRTDGCELFGPLDLGGRLLLLQLAFRCSLRLLVLLHSLGELFDVVVERDSPGKVAGIHHVINLVGQMPVVDGLDHGAENFPAERVNIGRLRLRVPAKVEQIVGRNLPQVGIVIGDRERVLALRIDHQQHVLRSTAGQRRCCPSQHEQCQQNSAPKRNRAARRFAHRNPERCQSQNGCSAAAPSREEQEGPACIIPEPRPASQTGIPVDVSLHNGDIKLSDGGLA